ncbi:hypothetical protein WDU94_006419 [Cyamophila willieti]
MGVQVSHLNNKLRLPLPRKLDGRVPPHFRMYKEETQTSDSFSNRNDIFFRYSEPPDYDVTCNYSGTPGTRTKRKLRRTQKRKKLRKRSASRYEPSSSSDSDERSFAFKEIDIDRHLSESSLECPGNVPIVISSSCILYQTKAGGCQEELPLQLGLIVNGIFKNQNWIYIETPHSEEGYVFFKYCIPLYVLPIRRSKQLSFKPKSADRNNPSYTKIYEDILDDIDVLSKTCRTDQEICDDLGNIVDETKIYDTIRHNIEELEYAKSGSHLFKNGILLESEHYGQFLVDWNSSHLIEEGMFHDEHGIVNNGRSIIHSNQRSNETIRSTNNLEASGDNLRGDHVADNVEYPRYERLKVDNADENKALTHHLRGISIESDDKKTRTLHLRGIDNEIYYERSDSSCFTDGGYFIDELVANKELWDVLNTVPCKKNGQFDGISHNSVRFDDDVQGISSWITPDFNDLNNIVDVRCSNIGDIGCDCGHINGGLRVENVQNDVHSQENQKWNDSDNSRERTRSNNEEKHRTVDERSKNNVYFNRNKDQSHEQHRSSSCGSISNENISRDFNFGEPFHNSTPVSQKHRRIENVSNDKKKSKKHCSSRSAHAIEHIGRFINPEPKDEGPIDQIKAPSAYQQVFLEQMYWKSNPYVSQPIGYLPKPYESKAYVDFSSQTNWDTVQDLVKKGHICEGHNNHQKDSNQTDEKSVILKSGQYDQKEVNHTDSKRVEYEFKTIEPIQVSHTKLVTSNNRVKKPCFKVHKLEAPPPIENNPKNGRLDKIVENRMEEQKAENENTKKCLEKTSNNETAKSEPLSELQTKNPRQKLSQNCERNHLPDNLDRYNQTKSGQVPPYGLNLTDRLSSKDNKAKKTVDTLSIASYPLMKKSFKNNRPPSVDNISVCSEKTIDELYIKYAGQSKSKHQRKSNKEVSRVGPKPNNLMLITEDYYNEDDRFSVAKNELVVLLNVYKSWLYVQTDKHQNGFIPSYIAAYAVM